MLLTRVQARIETIQTATHRSFFAVLTLSRDVNGSIVGAGVPGAGPVTAGTVNGAAVTFASSNWQRHGEKFAIRGCRRGGGQNELSAGGRESTRKIFATFLTLIVGRAMGVLR